jgi:8-oxo-dGTP pyrophosphatase MutT (NUDIX family)
MTASVFDPDPDPAEAARRLAMRRDLLGEADAIRQGASGPGLAPRPRDAATLILYRLDDDRPRILMGCRSKGHDFMPDKYVFPGGRVDTEDGAVPSLTELSASEEEALRTQARRRPRAFPLTAIREMFEETGLIVGRKAQTPASYPASWAEYFACEAVPCLQGMTFVGRAITPPMRSKRFDARFFMADAQQSLIDDRPPVDGAELGDLRWFTLAEALELDLPNVTRFVISEVSARLEGGAALRPFMLKWSRQGHLRERL